MKYIFIHGLGQNSSSWDKTLSFMKNKNDFLCLDLLTLLNNNSDNTYEKLYEVFSEYCNNISEPLNLCGLSLGGILALNYALDNPEKVKSLILIGTQDKMPKNLLKIQYYVFKLAPESIFGNKGFNKNQILQLMKSMMDLNFRENLKSISCATLIISGEKDNPNKKAAMSLTDNIQNANLIIIKNSGHEVNIDNPESLAFEIEKFYENIVGLIW